MALVKCPECNSEVSEYAKACPNCGFNVNEYYSNKKNNDAEEETKVVPTYEDLKLAQTKLFTTEITLNNATALFNGLIEAGKGIIEASYEKDKDSYKVYKCYLETIKTILEKQADELADVKDLAAAALKNRALAMKSDEEMILKCTIIDVFCLSTLFPEVTKEVVDVHTDLQDDVLECAKAYVKVRKNHKDRVLLYGAQPDNAALASFRKTFDSIINKLPESRKSEAPAWPLAATIQQNSQGCYIATCVYGSYDCPQVWTLRRFRDNILRKYWFGNEFIKFYYAVSPKLVKVFGDNKLFKLIWKSILDPMVSRLNKNGVEDTKYYD